MDYIYQIPTLFTSRFAVYKLKGRLRGHDAPINRLAIAPDGSFLSSGASDETVKIWNLNTMALIQALCDKHQRWGQITALKWVWGSGDDTILFIGTARGRAVAYKWTIQDKYGRLLFNEPIFQENTPVEDLSFHHNSQRLAAASALGEIQMFKLDLKGLSLTKTWSYQFKDSQGLTPIPRSLHHHGDTDLTVYLLESGQSVSFDSSLGVRKSTRNFTTPIGHVALSQDNTLSLVDNLSSGFDLYNTTEAVPKQSFELPGKQNHVKDAAFIENDSAVACPSEAGFIYIFGNNSPKPLQVLRHGCGVRRVDAHTSSTCHLILGASASKKKNEIYVWEKLVKPDKQARMHQPRLISFQRVFNLLCFVLALWATQDKWMPSINPTAKNVSQGSNVGSPLDSNKDLEIPVIDLQKQRVPPEGYINSFASGRVNWGSSLEQSMARLNRELERTEDIFRRGVEMVD